MSFSGLNFSPGCCRKQLVVCGVFLLPPFGNATSPRRQARDQLNAQINTPLRLCGNLVSLLPTAIPADHRTQLFVTFCYVNIQPAQRIHFPFISQRGLRQTLIHDYLTWSSTKLLVIPIPQTFDLVQLTTNISDLYAIFQRFIMSKRQSRIMHPNI